MGTMMRRPRAQQDLNDLWDIIADGAGVATADRFLRRVYRRFAMLADHPYAGRDRNDIRSGLRGSVVGRYIIFYYPTTDGIVISRVLYGGRDIAALYDAEETDDG